jgi:hypothetical protein
MKCRLAALSSLLATAVIGYSATELPETDDDDSFEVEPPILMPNREIDSGKSPVEPGRSNRDPIELEKQVERAKRTAVDAELLFKRGVLSKVEVETRRLRIVPLNKTCKPRGRKQMNRRQRGTGLKWPPPRRI